MSAAENDDSFREAVLKKSQGDPGAKNFLVWIYKWFTAMTIKNLMLTQNWDETKEIINEWRMMDRDIGPAVIGYSIDDNVKDAVNQIGDISNMLKEKQKAQEVA